MKVNGQLQALAALFLVVRGWLCPKEDLDVVTKRKILLLQENAPWYPGQFTEWGISAHPGCGYCDAKMVFLRINFADQVRSIGAKVKRSIHIFKFTSRLSLVPRSISY